MVTRLDLLAPVQEIAPLLLGARLQHRDGSGTVTVEVTEVEAYGGEGADPASHAHRGRTTRNAVMFGEPGTLYAYFIYGMHWCLNVVTGEQGTASAVLIRAGDVVEGLDVARTRRGPVPTHRLAQGPANLAATLGVTGLMNGVDLLDPDAPVRLLPAADAGPEAVTSGPRVGISKAVDRRWRWWVEGRSSVSRPRVR
jgi:DNA-3-methyladenine glycosylase